MTHLLNTSWMQFLLVTLAGFIIGLEMKSYQMRVHPLSSKQIGSARTFTFIAIMGYVFQLIGHYMLPIGFVLLGAHFLFYYWHKLLHERLGILSFLVASLVYSFGALIVNFPIWIFALLFVAIIFILNANARINLFVRTIEPKEIETFAKLILLSAVILPLLPKTPISPFLPISPFKIWLAVVVVSLLSYVGYILESYFFKAKGYFLTGILGGLYSSTAATIVLAKKSSEASAGANIFAASIVIATAVMYVRLFIIAFIFNHTIALTIVKPLLLLALISAGVAWFFYSKRDITRRKESITTQSNPLELPTAFLFALLFVVMVLVTHFVLKYYGNTGLKVLSFIVGFTDIDPFIVSILTSKFKITTLEAGSAILIAAGSNDILKASYAWFFSHKQAGIRSGIALVLIGVLTIGMGLALPYFHF